MVVKTKRVAVAKKAISQKKVSVETVPSKKVVTTRERKTQPNTRSSQSVTKKTLRLRVVEKAGSKKIHVPIHNNTEKRELPHASSKKSLPVPPPEKKAQPLSLRVKEALPNFRLPLLPAIPSSFRFPLVTPEPHRMARIARVMGVCFVFLGGIFSLIHLHSVSLNETYQLGALDAGFNQDALNREQYAQAPTPPAVTFSVNGGDEISGEVTVRMTVPNATSIVLSAYSLSDNRHYPLGSAQKIDDTTWKYEWDTTDIPDGECRLMATVSVQATTYGVQDTHTRTVKNLSHTNGEMEAGADEETHTSSTTDALSDEDVSSLVTLMLPSDTVIDGVASLSVRAPGATEVRIEVENVDTRVTSYLGLAKFIDTKWSYVWDTRTFSNGTYRITARALIDGSRVSDIGGDTLEVRNEKEAPSIVATPQSTTTHEGAPIEKNSDYSITPTISLGFSRQSPMSGYVEVTGKTSPGVLWLEMYARPKNSLTPFFLGLAQKKSDTEWRYVWQTPHSPNGEYVVNARVRTVYGFTESAGHTVSILNETTKALTEKEEKEIDTIHEVEKVLVQVTEDKAEEQLDSKEHSVIYIEPAGTFVSELGVTDEEKEVLTRELTHFESELNIQLEALAEAERSKNKDEFTKAQQKIEELKNSATQSLGERSSNVDTVTKISAYLSHVTYKRQEMTLQNEKIIRERIGDAVEKDSDRDSISDYDEIHLYHTNPYAGDTDSDGFIDSIELTRGFDPLLNAPQALVAYESPKEKGFVRDDLLKVTEVSTLRPETASGTMMAMIQGTALPNSFVTLYVFSTPVIVTVKTDDTGNWSYIFDKELEDGRHEVYIGMTDNAGRIVAKSSPLPFVKTAEAYVTGDERTVNTVVAQAEPSLTKGNSMLLVASIAIAALGLVLILIGLHSAPPIRRNDEYVTS